MIHKQKPTKEEALFHTSAQTVHNDTSLSTAQNTMDTLISISSEELKAIPDSQLKMILAPFFPAARKALLPPDKPEKKGLKMQQVNQLLARHADMIAQLKAAREKGKS